MPASCLENQEAASVPVTETGSKVITVETTGFLVASPLSVFFNVERAHVTHGTHPHSTRCASGVTLASFSAHHQLRNTRGRNSDLMQVRIATLLCLNHHSLQDRLQHLLRTPAEATKRRTVATVFSLCSRKGVRPTARSRFFQVPDSASFNRTPQSSTCFLRVHCSPRRLVLPASN